MVELGIVIPVSIFAALVFCCICRPCFMICFIRIQHLLLALCRVFGPRGRRYSKVNEHELDDDELGHLSVAVPITLHQAIIGGKVSAPLPEGGKVNLTLPAGIELPKRMRIPKRGMTTKEGRGHLYLKPYIYAPERPEDEERAAELDQLLTALDVYYH